EVARGVEGPRPDVAQRQRDPGVVSAPGEDQHRQQADGLPLLLARLRHHAFASASGRLISISTKAIGCGEPFITSCSTPGGRRYDWPATRVTALSCLPS